jgi:F420-0:gamma-glutamyl ligase-like protein
MQFGISALGGFVVSALQDRQLIPTPVPMAGTIAVCSIVALTMNLVTRSRRTEPNPAEEAEGALLAAE